MSVTMRRRGAPVARLSPTPMTGTDGGYPWHDGELLYADDLNAAITASSASVLDLGAKGDGVTDDTAAIQSALNAYAGKAVVFIPNTGKPYMVRPLSLPSNTDMTIDGWLMLLPVSTGPVLNADGVNNVIIRGCGIVDGNRSAQTPPGNLGGVSTLNATRVRISDITIRNAYYWNLNVVTSTDVIASGVTMLGGRNANEFAAGSNNCWLMNCIVDGPDSDIGFSFYGGVINSGTIGTTFRNAGIAGAAVASGIGVFADTDQPAGCSNILISDNYCYNNGGSGIGVSVVPGSPHHSSITIANNQCYSNGRLGSGGYADIHVVGVDNILISGNQSANFGATSDAWYGLAIGTTVSGANIIGNVVYGVGHGGTSGTGMTVASAATVTAIGNFFFDNRGAPVMTTSIGGTAGVQNAYIGNYCTKPVTITPSPDTVMANGVSGLWTTNATEIDGNVNVVGPGIRYNGGNDIAFNWLSGGRGLQYQIDGTLTEDTLMGSHAIQTGASYANDAAAAAGGVLVGQAYRNGSIVMVRVT